MEISPPVTLKKPLKIPEKILMGPGPSNSSARVLEAMSKPILGHLHPELLQIMDDIKSAIKYAFQTHNEATICVSAAGHAGMEMALCNLIEDGSVVLLGTSGHWGQRAADIAARHGAIVYEVKAPLGTALTVADISAAFAKHKPQVFFVAQGESSTGVLQPHLRQIGELCRLHNCLFIVDTVASFGGTEFLMDAWYIDVAYVGTQKVLGAPPGITPISFSDRAIRHIEARKSKVDVYYFDALLNAQYWGCYGWSRIYHHTISCTLLYGLREALAQFCEEGLEATIARHRLCGERLQRGLQELGLELLVKEPSYRMSTVIAVKIPDNLDWKSVIDYAMKTYLLEIGGGLGPTANKVFRIGVMGVNATPARIDFLLKVFKEGLERARLQKSSSKI